MACRTQPRLWYTYGTLQSYVAGFNGAADPAGAASLQGVAPAQVVLPLGAGHHILGAQRQAEAVRVLPAPAAVRAGDQVLVVQLYEPLQRQRQAQIMQSTSKTCTLKCSYDISSAELEP